MTQVMQNIMSESDAKYHMGSMKKKCSIERDEYAYYRSKYDSQQS